MPLNDTDKVTMTVGEIGTFLKETVSETLEANKETTKALVEEAIKTEKARNTLPDAFKSNGGQAELRATAKKNSLGIALYALGSKGKFNNSIENVYKSLGQEVSMYLSEDMVHKLNNENTLSVKTLQSISSATDGGFLIRETYYDQIIPMIQEEAKFMKAGAQSVSMPSGTLTMTKQTGITAAYWQGENDAKRSSKKTWGQINLSSKIITAQVPISNKLLQRADVIDVGRDIVADITLQVALLQDKTFLMTGTNTSKTPKSLAKIATNTFAMSKESNAFNVNTITNDIERAKRILITKDLAIRKGAWFMSEEDSFRIQCQRNPTTLQLMDYAEELRNNHTLYGYPVFESIFMREDDTKSSIILADMSYVYVGNVSGLEIKFTPDGTYEDADGTVISGLSRGESVYTAEYETDMDCVNNNAIVRITGVTWGK